jgi:hypothetical protein
MIPARERDFYLKPDWDLRENYEGTIGPASLPTPAMQEVLVSPMPVPPPIWAIRSVFDIVLHAIGTTHS